MERTWERLVNHLFWTFLFHNGSTHLLLAFRVHRDCERLSARSCILALTLVVSQDTGNKVSRRATIAGPQNIVLGGKTIISSGAIIRGDLRRTGPGHTVVIQLGRYCLLGEGCIMRFVAILRPWIFLPITGHKKAAVQDLSWRFQLLSYEDW